MKPLHIVLIVGAVLIVVALRSALFVVDAREQALVLQFGEVVQVRTEPGLGVKVPFIQDVVLYDKRILPLESGVLQVIPADKRQLEVEAFARWRITDVVLFRQSVQTKAQALNRLGSILESSVRGVLGTVNSADILSPERTNLMTRIRDNAREQAKALGVEIIDVRIRRADLPDKNLAATFARMNAERQREAADERARGKERAQEIRATADRKAVELISEAQRDADVTRGKADAQRTNIYAKAYGRDPEFFAFVRSLKAYQDSMKGSNSTLVLSPRSEFFEYLNSNRVGGPIAGPR
jgi:membrane protease subunit HflC